LADLGGKTAQPMVVTGFLTQHPVVSNEQSWGLGRHHHQREEAALAAGHETQYHTMTEIANLHDPGQTGGGAGVQPVQNFAMFPTSGQHAPESRCTVEGKCGQCHPTTDDPSLCTQECFKGLTMKTFGKNPACPAKIVPMDYSVKLDSGKVVVNVKGKTSNISVWKGKMAGEGAFVFKQHSWEARRLPKTHSALINIQALQTLTQECGTSRFYVRNAYRNMKVGKKVMKGQVMDMAQGTSVASLVNSASIEANDQLQKSIQAAGPDLPELAISELLFCGGDTNMANVFLTSDGKVTIIDHDSYFEERAMCNSVLLPGTSHMIKKVYLRALDYRCYASGGAIGRNYPPKLAQCISKLAGMSVKDMGRAYKLPPLLAGKLQKRAELLNTVGFEDTMTATGCGAHLNERPTRVRKPKNLLGKWKACCAPPPLLTTIKNTKAPGYGKAMKPYKTEGCPTWPAAPVAAGRG